MKNKILFFLVLFLLFSIDSKVSASELCSPDGYTIVTVNGIFTDENGAKLNKNRLSYKIPYMHNDQVINEDYLYNATHLGGIGDLIDAATQGLFDQKSDYDLTEMINDASQKITTQKILLVAHSQGNFYSNNFYDKIASQQGGVPEQSIGVYGVASPANRVAGNGKYLTSDTDNVIAATVARFINILPPNVHIPLQNGDGNGHSFADVYLKYQSDRIVSDIKYSLDRLQNNDEQETDEPCISPPELTLFHKIEGKILKFADFVIDATKTIFNYIINSAKNIFGLRANVIESLPDKNTPKIFSDLQSKKTIPQQVTPQKKIAKIVVDEIKKEKKIEEKILPKVEEKKIVTPVTTKIVTNTGGGGAGGGGSGGGGGGSTPPADTTAPVISIIGANPMNIIKGNAYVELGATALDAVDGVRSIVISGTVNTAVVGVYNIIYTAKDLSNNTRTATRVVNVVAGDAPPAVDTTPPVITILGNNPEIVVKNSAYVDAGATALDAVDGVRTVNTTGTVDTTELGNFIITYTASDVAGNIAIAVRTINIVSNKYIPKYSFGKNNGDGNNWLVWAFNGSYVYDWSDTYVDNYLREQFKIKNDTGTWCSQCLQRGIFNHDPQQGFQVNDFSVSSLEGNPQNNMDGVTYNVVLQWDDTGYTYTISHDSVVDSTGHKDVPNMNNNLWVAWDGSFNNFSTFPSGDWYGVVNNSPLSRTGGGSMVLPPYPVYKNENISAISILSLPIKDNYASRGVDPTRGRTNLTPFSFKVIYTDKNNNAPQNVKLHIKNTTTGTNLSEVVMQKMLSGGYSLSDEDFSNGEAYVVKDLIYDTGDYDYYFSAVSSSGDQIRIPENSFLNFTVIPSTYTYIPQYSFGTENGDGHNWQVWAFNGSYAYEWSDTYVNSYLKEQFKIKTDIGTWCSQCLQRGIFNHDPQKGFETYDVIMSSLESNPQNNMNNTVYDVVIEWDSTGYDYTISHGDVVDATGHTDVANVNENMWVGWDGSFNNFSTFPSGDWYGFSPSFPPGYSGGGGSMILQPYRVYDQSQISSLSSLKKITKFNFSGLNPEVVGVINESNHTISLTVPLGTDMTNLSPTIRTLNHSTVSPDNNVAQNFSSPVTYTVTAENGSTQNYIVTVFSSDIPPDGSLPSITSYTFNGNAGDIIISPTTNPVSLVLTASENVNWMSIKIEKEDNDALYKLFYSGDGCVDGTNTCTKTWDGTLSGGDSLQNGVYRIKVHMQDSNLNDFNDYLLPYKITVNIGT